MKTPTRPWTTAVFAMACAAAPAALWAHPPGPPRTPPPEAYGACAQSTAGAACTVQRPEHTVSGTCVQRGEEAQLHCRPSGPPPGDRPPPHHRKPPAEAYAACAQSSADSACTVQLPERTIGGVCVARPDEQALHCRPTPPPPPPEAYAACAQSSAGSACTVQLPEHTISGRCTARPDEQALHCRPDRPPHGAPPPHGDRPPPPPR